MRKIKKIMMVAMRMILVAGMVMPLHAAGKVTVKARDVYKRQAQHLIDIFHLSLSGMKGIF